MTPSLWKARITAGTQQNVNGFTVVKSKKRRARETTDTESGHEEEDVVALKRTLRVSRPGRFAIKEIG